MAVLRGGVIGFGNTGRQMTDYINGKRSDVARIVAACNRGQAALDVAEKDYGLRVTHDPAELVSWDLDFVLVVSTSYGHAEQVELAAGGGRHVFCEKPIALTLADADRMIAAVERAGVVSSVNYGMRHIEAYRTIKQLVDTGELGELLEISHSKTRAFGLYASGARHRAVVEPRESGGWTVHHACHDIDFVAWVAGRIREVYALTRTTAPGGSEEIVLGMIKFAGGAVGSIADSVCCIRDHYTRLVGSRASLVMTGEHEETVLRLHREGAKAAERITARDTKRDGGGLDHFFECIRAGRLSEHDLRSARHSLEAALAMQESARTGAPVAIPG
jgi:predicted dehydrogenase